MVNKFFINFLSVFYWFSIGNILETYRFGMSKKQTACARKFLRSDARLLSPEAIEEIRNAPKNIPNAQSIMCKRHRIGAETYKKIINNQRPSIPTEEWRSIVESVSISDNKNPLLHSREVPSDQNSDDNQKSSHNSSSFSSDSMRTQIGKKKSKSVRISDSKDLSEKVDGGLEIKKEQVLKIPPSSNPLPIVLQDSEDALEIFKKAQNGMEKAVAKGRALAQKMTTGT